MAQVNPNEPNGQPHPTPGVATRIDRLQRRRTDKRLRDGPAHVHPDAPSLCEPLVSLRETHLVHVRRIDAREPSKEPHVAPLLEVRAGGALAWIVDATPMYVGAVLGDGPYSGRDSAINTNG